MERRVLLWALVGNIVVGFGAGTATLAAFSPTLPLFDSPHFVFRVLIVSIGFALFFAGYHITQAGTYRDPNDSLRGALLPGPDAGNSGAQSRSKSDSNGSDPVILLRSGFILMGVFGLGAGMRLFALTIASWDPVLGGTTGLVCIGGYICGHIGINGVLI